MNRFHQNRFFLARLSMSGLGNHTHTQRPSVHNNPRGAAHLYLPLLQRSRDTPVNLARKKEDIRLEYVDTCRLLHASYQEMWRHPLELYLSWVQKFLDPRSVSDTILRQTDVTLRLNSLSLWGYRGLCLLSRVRPRVARPYPYFRHIILIRSLFTVWTTQKHISCRTYLCSPGRGDLPCA